MILIILHNDHLLELSLIALILVLGIKLDFVTSRDLSTCCVQTPALFETRIVCS